MRLGGQRHAPAAWPPGKTRYPFYSKLGGPQGWSGRVRKVSPPPGFDPRTIQPLANCYPGPPLTRVLNTKCSSWIKKKRNEDFISFPDHTCHFWNYFLPFREIWGLGPKQKSSSWLILIHNGSYNPKFRTAAGISQVWICLCRKQNEGGRPMETSIQTA
jgi:hypothetical protein